MVSAVPMSPKGYGLGGSLGILHLQHPGSKRSRKMLPQLAARRVVLLVQTPRRKPLEASVVQQLQMSGAVILCIFCGLRLGY